LYHHHTAPLSAAVSDMRAAVGVAARALRAVTVAGACGLGVYGLAASAAAAAQLSVGPGQPFRTVASAIAAAQDGDTINVQAGTYLNDFAEIGAKVVLQAVGGRVQMKATGYIPNGKGILITDTDVTIIGFTFSGAKVTDANGGNGAGVRYQGGNLLIKDCYFLHNQDGLLSNPDPSGTITIENSEFFRNGATTGVGVGATHNIYVGAVKSLDIQNSYVHDANIGHEIKSRALQTTVNATRVVEGPTGTASYSIDLPNGGVGVITNNQIEQGPLSQNPIMITTGEEGGVYPGSSLVVSGNLIANELNSPSVLGVRNSTGAVAQVTGNQVYGLSAAQLVSGPASVSGNQCIGTAPTIPTNHPW